jgi:hypothetical protein
MRITAAMHGIKVDDEKLDIKNPDNKNEINKKAAMKLMAFGGFL